MFLIFISYIIISNFSRRKIIVKTTSLIQKSLNFSIFLFFSKIILKIINFLNFLIFTIFSRAVNMFSMFNLYIKIIIFAALMFCIRFIFCSFLIHVINFIFLFNFRFERMLISRRRNVEIAIIDCLIVIFVQVFSSIVFFVFFVIFFNLVIYLSKHSFVVFVTFTHS